MDITTFSLLQQELTSFKTIVQLLNIIKQDFINIEYSQLEPQNHELSDKTAELIGLVEKLSEKKWAELQEYFKKGVKLKFRNS